MATINPDGSPQVSIVWVGLDGDDIVLAHLGAGQKMRDVERDPWVALSIEGTEIEPPGLQHYVVVHGTARITEGGGPQLLQELAHVYLGPDVKFPAFDNPPPGRIMHISARGHAETDGRKMSEAEYRAAWRRHGTWPNAMDRYFEHAHLGP